VSDESFERAQVRVGTTLKGKYHIDRVLGVGGMASVYAATHRNKKRFAIKMLHPELSVHGDARQRFLREGYVANTVDHPSAVAVLDDDVAEDGSAFIVMELLDGVALDELAERSGGRLPPMNVLCIADQLLAVLEAAHARGIVHRDLKPANLFLLRDGTLKVLDFGIARLREAVTSGPSSATQTGALMGTPAFLPPEQAGGHTREIDGQTDLWAVGATMFNLLTGEFIHLVENATQMIIAAATKPARSLGSVVTNQPAIVALVDRALAFEKASRWPNAAAMRQRVREVCRETFGAEPSRERLVESPTTSDQSPWLARTHPAPQHSATSGVTAEPVERSHVSLPYKRAPVGWLAAGVVGLAAVGVGVVELSHARQGARATDAPIQQPSANIVATQPAASSVAPTDVASATSAASASDVPSTPHIVAVPPAHATMAVTRPTPTKTAAGAVGKPPQSRPTATAATSANCNPPYTVDATGKHHYKPECL